MSEFEKWFEDQDFYTNMRFIHGDKLFDKDDGAYRVLPVQMIYLAWLVGRAGIQEMDEVIRMQDADLRKYEKQIESLKAQLNNMEACYIEVKKERDELEAAKRDYVCDCGYLDSPDYEECDCRKHSEDLANEVIAEIVKKANFSGLEELLDELKCRAIKHGVLLNKKALRGDHE